MNDSTLQSDCSVAGLGSGSVAGLDSGADSGADSCSVAGPGRRGPARNVDGLPGSAFGRCKERDDGALKLARERQDRAVRFMGLIEKRGITSQALAEKAGVSRTSIYNLTLGIAGELVRMKVREFLTPYERFLIGDMEYEEWCHYNGKYFEDDLRRRAAFDSGYYFSVLEKGGAQGERKPN